jgi:hypothetical protein
MPPPSNIVGKDKKKGEVTVPSSLPKNGMSYAMTLSTIKKDTGDIKIPEFEPPNLKGPLQRKLQIFPKEFGEESSYSNAEMAALYCFL